MKQRLTGILLLCWLIPFSVMFGVMVIYMAFNHGGETAENFRRQAEFNNVICMERLNAAVEASRQASYDKELVEAGELQRGGGTTQIQLRKTTMDYLTEHYLKNAAVSCAFFWYYHDEETLYSVYNVGAEGSYQKLKTFQESDFEEVRDYAEGLDTKVGFFLRDNRLYLVRNLVDSRFVKRGVLVFRINKTYCFRSLSEYPSGDGVYVKLNDLTLFFQGKNEQLAEWLPQALQKETPCEWHKGRLYVANACSGNSFRIETAIRLEKKITQYPFYGYQYVMTGLLLSLIPLLLVVIRTVKRQVTEPVKALSKGAELIERGELGYQIGEIHTNREFEYLRSSFNNMSSHLKQQFDRIYEEEVALREAKIMALQSHINPHFLNNTLEIINWEARLCGNDKVARMIGALSDVLDAALNRSKRPQVRLSEEMNYINSYLYIAKERLGERLTVVTEIPDELMNCLVPRLILQPVVENAIEHGVVPNREGTILIRGYRDEKYLYLETRNDGGLTKEDKEKINRLLSADYNREEEKSSNLGIANVNQRLRIFFGEPCGLTIEEGENGSVTARLTMPYST